MELRIGCHKNKNKTKNQTASARGGGARGLDVDSISWDKLP